MNQGSHTQLTVPLAMQLLACAAPSRASSLQTSPEARSSWMGDRIPPDTLKAPEELQRWCCTALQEAPPRVLVRLEWVLRQTHRREDASPQSADPSCIPVCTEAVVTTGTGALAGSNCRHVPQSGGSAPLLFPLQHRWHLEAVKGVGPNPASHSLCWKNVLKLSADSESRIQP